MPKPRPGRSIRQHAGTIVFAEHHQDAGANEQPEQPQPWPESAPRPRRRNPFAVVRSIDVLMRDDDAGSGSGFPSQLRFCLWWTRFHRCRSQGKWPRTRCLISASIHHDINYG